MASSTKKELVPKSCININTALQQRRGWRLLRVYDETLDDVVSAKRTQSQLWSLRAAPTDAQVSARQEQHPSFVLLPGRTDAGAEGRDGGVTREAQRKQGLLDPMKDSSLLYRGFQAVIYGRYIAGGVRLQLQIYFDVAKSVCM